MNIERNIHEIIASAVRQSVERAIEIEAAEAAKRVEKRVKDYGATIATNVCQWMSLEPYGRNQIKIVLDFRTPEERRNEQKDV